LFGYASNVPSEVEECDCHISLLGFVYSNASRVIPTPSVVFNRADRAIIEAHLAVIDAYDGQIERLEEKTERKVLESPAVQ
jgi:hypothetical protein